MLVLLHFLVLGLGWFMGWLQNLIFVVAAFADLCFDFDAN